VFRFGVMTAIAVALVLLPRAALAHAVLVRSSPAIHSTMHGPDVAVAMKFSSRVDGARSTILLSTPDGQSLPVTIERQSTPDTLTAHLTHLKRGKYAIRWQVLAVDGHVTRGEIPFNVS
jgi:hypothetical protein